MKKNKKCSKPTTEAEILLAQKREKWISDLHSGKVDLSNDVRYYMFEKAVSAKRGGRAMIPIASCGMNKRK